MPDAIPVLSPALARPDSLVVFASSIGGINALSIILAGLPAGFPAALVAVQHLDPDFDSKLAEILGRRTVLRVKKAQEGDGLAAGTVYVAPPDHHVVVNADATLSLTHTEKVHHVRPSAEPLFASAAAHFGGRVTAVVLTGYGGDGSLALPAVRAVGGTVIAQQPDTAEAPSMPLSAIDSGMVDLILPLEEIAGALVRLSASPDRSRDGRVA